MSPWSRIASRLGAHPPGFAALVVQQAIQKLFSDAATRAWLNKGRISAFASRSDDGQSSSIASIDAPVTTTFLSW